MKERVAFYLQGGGMRCAYTAGALVAMSRCGMRPTAGIWASSAAAAIGAYIAADQPDGVEEIWLEHLPGWNKVFRWTNLLWKPVLNSEYLYALFSKVVPLDVPQLKRCTFPLMIAVTDVASGTGQWIDAHDEKYDPIALICASMALPIFHPPYLLNGSHMLDGSIRYPVPLPEHRRGVHNIVVLTRPLHSADKEGLTWWQVRWLRTVLRTYPKAQSACMSQAMLENIVFEQLKEKARRGECMVIAPREALPARRTSFRLDTIRATFRVGFWDGINAVRSLRNVT